MQAAFGPSVRAMKMRSLADASLNRTCELGLTRATGRPYRHVLEVLAEGYP